MKTAITTNERLTALMKRNSLSRSDTALIVGVNTSAVDRWCADRHSNTYRSTPEPAIRLLEMLEKSGALKKDTYETLARIFENKT